MMITNSEINKSLKKNFKGLKVNYSFKKITTMKIGGLARYFLVVKKETELVEAIFLAQQLKLKWYIIGDGSNLIPDDLGFDGLIIKNQITDFIVQDNKIFIGAGNNLLNTILNLDKLGLAGLEKMAGIPGTIGGAIYGSAGAYGQEIKDCLSRVRIFDGKVFKWLSKKNCRFQYRNSLFKSQKNLIIVGVEFICPKKEAKELLKISQDIIKLREKKYQPGLLCPGSFFKNIVIKDIGLEKIRKKLLSKIDSNKVIFGKIPVGHLLETVGARGLKQGGVIVASHHGNLLYHEGKGRAKDVVILANLLKNRVKKHFGIIIEEEVQYVK
ncbi:UDP-N-acetylmuramate dehydrogenase [Candidatus Azambacteria bacterium]|nr:UDP-N-acetylmuramate dehydrogenase [Candidatus Azambacteria bacterium]